MQPDSETTRLVTFTDHKGTQWTIEKNILRPCLMDIPLECFGKLVPNSWIIFPYKIIGDKAELYTPTEMKARFPRCWDYLSAYKANLVPPERSVQNYTSRTWYRYGRSQSLTKFDGKPKLIWPVLSLEPKYAYDNQSIVFTGGGNGPYYALVSKKNSELSVFYILAILSHPVLEAMIQEKSSKFRSGYGSHGKQFIQDIPIKTIDFNNPNEEHTYREIIALVKQLITTTERLAKATTPQKKALNERAQKAQKRRLYRLVEKLYGITIDDLKTLEQLAGILGGDDE